MSLILATRAFDSAGNIVSIDTIESGLAIECRCIGCGGVMFARRGPKVTQHFYHKNNNDGDSEGCASAGETDLHIIAKEVISEDKCITVPIGTIEPRSEYLKFDDVVWEKMQGNTIPDITAFLNGEMIQIEIAVTHPSSLEKITKLKKSNVNCVEFDLSEFYTQGTTVNKDKVRIAIKKSTAKWLSVKACGDFGEKMHQHNKNKMRSLISHYRDKKASLEKDYREHAEHLRIQNKNLEISDEELIVRTNKLNNLDSKIIGSNSRLSKLQNGVRQLEDREREAHLLFNDARESIDRINKKEKDLEFREIAVANNLEVLATRKDTLETEGKALAKKKTVIDQSHRNLNKIIDEKSSLIAEEKFQTIIKERKVELDKSVEEKRKLDKDIATIKHKFRSYLKI